MREELFAHLATSFEEELTHLGEEGAAAERRSMRLGEAGELTRSLQDSVPWIERVMYTRLVPAGRTRDLLAPSEGRIADALCRADHVVDDYIGRRSGSGRRDGRRRGTRATRGLAGRVRLGRRVAPRDRRGRLRIPVPLRRDGSRTRGRFAQGLPAALFAALSSLMVIALVAGFVLIVSVGARHGQVFQRSDWLRLLPVALLAPFVLIVAAHDTMSWRRRRDGCGLSEIPS